jgi:hypothetical protein
MNEFFIFLRLRYSSAGRLRMLIAKNGESISNELCRPTHNAPALPHPNKLGLLDLATLYDPNINNNPVFINSKRPLTPEDYALIVY